MRLCHRYPMFLRYVAVIRIQNLLRQSNTVSQVFSLYCKTINFGWIEILGI